jgi:hypothetical protein
MASMANAHGHQPEEPISAIRQRVGLGILDGAQGEATVQMSTRDQARMVALAAGDEDEPTLLMAPDRPTHPEGFVLRRQAAREPSSSIRVELTLVLLALVGGLFGTQVALLLWRSVMS